MEAFECYLLEYAGAYTTFHDGVATPLYRRVDNGAFEHGGWSEHPGFTMMKPGALFFELFSNGLVVRTPGGDWHVDRNSSKSNRPWYREGELPSITVTPSILIEFKNEDGTEYEAPNLQRKFHGVLTNGVLREVP